MKTLLVTIGFFFIFSLAHNDALSATRFKMPKQSWVRQIGGNAKQKSTLSYDRGGKRHTVTVKPGQTKHVPRDAKNVYINGMRLPQGKRVTTSPQGASLFED